MDPLTAVGLGGNIIAFVDFGLKVLKRVKQLHEAETGATEENDELESLARNLKSLTEKTRHRPTEASERNSRFSINSETILDNLGRQCTQVADELLEVLDSVKVKGDGRTRSALKVLK